MKHLIIGAGGKLQVLLPELLVTDGWHRHLATLLSNRPCHQAVYQDQFAAMPDAIKKTPDQCMISYQTSARCFFEQ